LVASLTQRIAERTYLSTYLGSRQEKYVSSFGETAYFDAAIQSPSLEPALQPLLPLYAAKETDRIQQAALLIKP
jgi:hypothetical protein